MQGVDCLLYTSDAADERSSVDLGGRRIIKKNTQEDDTGCTDTSLQIDSAVVITEKITYTQQAEVDN